MNKLVELVYSPLETWDTLTRDAFARSLVPRYVRVTEDAVADPRGEGERRFQLRVNTAKDLKNIPFAALIGPDQERSGAYGGMSFVLFPSREEGVPALVGIGGDGGRHQRARS